MHETARARRAQLAPLGLRFVSAGAFAAAFAAGATPAAAASVCPGHFRVMTYNVACLPGAYSNEDLYEPLSDRARMDEVAKAVLAEQPDAVVINEAWSDECKDELVTKLESTFPSFLHDLTNHGAEGQDSGLMVFSRTSFVEFTQDVPQTSGADLATGLAHGHNGPGTKWGEDSRRQVAYHIYGSTECDGVDCMAAKGAAMVRIKDADGCNYNVAFTHTQAHYFLDDHDDMDERMAARARQLSSVADMINGALTVAQLQTEPVVFAGDLNVDGNRAHPGMHWAAGHPESDRFDVITDDTFGCGSDGDRVGTDCMSHSSVGRTVPINDPLGSLLVDSGFWETSMDDLLQTANGSLTDPTGGGDLTFPPEAPDPTQGFRYDYIFHNQPTVHGAPGSETLCMQHIHRRFIGPGDPNLSDHLALIADFDQRAPHCMAVTDPTFANSANLVPSLASSPNHRQTFGAGGFPDAVNTLITFPGSVQWYVLDETGSVNIALGAFAGASLTFEVFQGSDLSRPISSFHHETTTWTDVSPRRVPTTFVGTKFSLIAPPYFVKVFAKDPLATGTYNISFQRNDCTAPTDACPLQAAVLATTTWPAMPVVPNSGPAPFYGDRLYYTFYTNNTSTGQAPNLSFLLQTTDGALIDPVSATAGVHLFDAATFDVTKPDCVTPGATCNTVIDLQHPMAWDTSWQGPPGALFKFGAVEHGSLPPDASGQKQYLLRVARQQIAPFTMSIRYQTDLTLFQAKSLLCQVQEDLWGHDDITLDATFDSSTPSASCAGLTTADEIGRLQSDGKGGSGSPLELTKLAKLQGRFASAGASFRMCEIDDIDPNDLLLFKTNPIGPLDPTTVSQAPTITVSDTGDLDSADYLYQFTFTESHEDLNQ